MTTGQQSGRLIDWTGERCVPWSDDLQMVYEHYHRYALASHLVAGKRVLDLASGEGYGAALLAATAEYVLGLEIDDAAVRHAQRRYSGSDVEFRTGSIVDPGVLSGLPPFDVVVCFEAVEHVQEHDALMRLVRRGLAPGGVFVCSTPDVREYTDTHGNDNPFHVRELDEAQFRQLLGSQFPHVVLLRQNVAVGSLIHGGEPVGASRTHTLTPDGDGWAVRDGAPHTYLIGIASDEPVEHPGTSVLADPARTLVERAARDSSTETARLRDTVEELRSALGRSEDAATDAANALAAARDDAQALASERDAAQAEVESLRIDQRRLADRLDRSHAQAEHDDARLKWMSDNNATLRRTANDLAEQNAQLRAQQSAAAYRMISRYRSAVEHLAPRGTYRRHLYETALGRAAQNRAANAPAEEPVAVTTSESPIVSVVVPVYGKWTYTRSCLESIETHLPTVPFEVIVVDDGSTDGSVERVRQCPGTRLIQSERNRGFVGACNLGAAHARGELLMFLNNDTEVTPDWLDALVEVLEAQPDVGIAGSQLRYPDGRLQECGAITWSDGTGWNYGRGDTPDSPRYRATRAVDYCSGAALLVRAALFEQLGGFDGRYAPAYYEDTDLAFAARELGYRTVVAPKSVVVHHEGVSNGTGADAGVKRHQEINRSVFVEKWSHRLVEHSSGTDAGNLWVARQRGRRGHQGGLVLVADHQVPRPDTDSGSVRMLRILELLVESGERVVFFAMNHATPPEYTQPLQERGITVLADPGRQGEFLQQAGSRIRSALLSRPAIAWQLLERLRELAPESTVVYDTVDLHFVRLGRQAELAGRLGDTAGEASLRRRSTALREMELGLVRAVDVTVTVSEAERAILRELVPHASVRVLGNVHDVDPTPAVAEGRSAVTFVGGFDHHPNRDAATWLATEIMPLVWGKHPEAVVHIVGSNPPDEVLELRGDGVLVHGWVADLGALYRRTRVAVAPLRFGAGVKGKVGESLAYGVPVAGTPVAAEGMHLSTGAEILLGETAEEIAGHIVRLLDDDGEWARISAAGRAAVSQRFGRAAARDSLADLGLGTGADCPG